MWFDQELILCRRLNFVRDSEATNQLEIRLPDCWKLRIQFGDYSVGLRMGLYWQFDRCRVSEQRPDR
jgi:hypothetical protein